MAELKVLERCGYQGSERSATLLPPRAVKLSLEIEHPLVRAGSIEAQPSVVGT